MSKYLIKASYSPDGIKGLLKEGGSARKKVVDNLIGGMGGKVEAFYYAFGEHDAYIVADLPDAVSAAAIGLAVNSTGVVATSTTVLLTPEEIDKATKKTVNYRAPGSK